MNTKPKNEKLYVVLSKTDLLNMLKGMEDMPGHETKVFYSELCGGGQIDSFALAYRNESGELRKEFLTFA